MLISTPLTLVSTKVNLLGTPAAKAVGKSSSLISGGSACSGCDQMRVGANIKQANRHRANVFMAVLTMEFTSTCYRLAVRLDTPSKTSASLRVVYFFGTSI